MSGQLLSVLSIPAELAFRGAVSLRSAAYDRGLLSVHQATVPVICVGNLTVGGTGKTPLVRWVVRVLGEAGRRPAVAVSGYGRDEMLLHRCWNPTASVHSHADRVRAAQASAASGADVVVLDDGFQHRRLARDLDLVVISAEQPFPGRLLPRGPYRESPAALRRADLVVVTHRSATAVAVARLEETVQRVAPGVPLVRAWLAPGRWEGLGGKPSLAPRGQVLAATGVAGPSAFAALVGEQTGAAVEMLEFSDHHEFTPWDVGHIGRVAGGRTVVVTEKDAVKLRDHVGILPDVRVLTLTLEVESGEELLRERILAVGVARRS
jgi:tetraacyldisaccharide 4'-kinase